MALRAYLHEFFFAFVLLLGVTAVSAIKHDPIGPDQSESGYIKVRPLLRRIRVAETLRSW